MTSYADAGPEDAAKVRFVRRRAAAVFGAHGYRELLPSALEPVGTAARIGAALAAPALPDGRELRLDAMVSLARAYGAGPDRGRFARRMMGGALFDPHPAGRLRSPTFEIEAGVIFGVSDPAADAEVCALAHALGGDPGLGGAEVVVSTVGDAGDLERYAGRLAELGTLACPRCLATADPLRFLGCDEEGCRALAQSAPPLRDEVSTPARRHHEALLALLEAAGVPVRDDPRLAFGSTRYRRTILELRALEGDDTRLVVARGGRRDNLVAATGGPQTPAVGLTLGLMRAAACVSPADASFEPGCEIFFAAQGARARAWAFRAAAAERARGFRVDVDLGDGSWDEQLARADELHARVVVLCGEDERQSGAVQLRDLRSQQALTVPEAELSSILKRLLR